MPRTVQKGLGRYRLAQLRSDLKLSPEARVLLADEPLPEVIAPPGIVRGDHDARRTAIAPRRRGGPARVAERPVPVPADRFKSKLALVCSVLNEASARYVVVGARALQLWGTSRFTLDTDILIEPTHQNAERVLDALSRLGFGVAADFTAEEVLARTVTVIADTPRVDILTRAWNLRWEVASPRATVFNVEGIDIPTASIEDLIESKRTDRLKDLADIEVLEAIRKERGGRAK